MASSTAVKCFLVVCVTALFRLSSQQQSVTSPYQGTQPSFTSSISGPATPSAAEIIAALTPEQLKALTPQQRLKLQQLLRHQQQQQIAAAQELQKQLQQAQQQQQQGDTGPMLVGFTGMQQGGQQSTQPEANYLLSGANAQQGPNLQDAAYNKDSSSSSSSPQLSPFPFQPPPGAAAVDQPSSQQGADLYPTLGGTGGGTGGGNTGSVPQLTGSSIAAGEPTGQQQNLPLQEFIAAASGTGGGPPNSAPSAQTQMPTGVTPEQMAHLIHMKMDQQQQQQQQQPQTPTASQQLRQQQQQQQQQQPPQLTPEMVARLRQQLAARQQQQLQQRLQQQQQQQQQQQPQQATRIGGQPLPPELLAHMMRQRGTVTRGGGGGGGSVPQPQPRVAAQPPAVPSSLLQHMMKQGSGSAAPKQGLGGPSLSAGGLLSARGGGPKADGPLMAIKNGARPSPLTSQGAGGLTCPRVAQGAMCSGHYHHCSADANCADGAKCCGDACGMICKRAVPVDAAILPGSLLVDYCRDPNCAGGGGLWFNRKRETHSECDAIKACRKGHSCCFDGCRNICRNQNAPTGGGGIFGNSVGKMDNNMMMMMMATAGS